MKASRFVAKCIVMALATLLTPVVLLLAIPDANDHVMVTVDKNARLRQAGTPKVVFVGGSNLAYGLDSECVARALPYNVVNMGLNAFLGVRFLLNEVEESVDRGDVVVLSFEHELFFTAPDNDFVDGAPTDQLLLIKARPAAFHVLATWNQRLAVVKAVPLVAQRKLGRLVSQGLAHMRGQVDSLEPEVGSIDWVEGSRAGYNHYGDLLRHLDQRAQKPELEEGRSFHGQSLRGEVFSEIHLFRRRMRERGVTVLFLPPPTPRSYYTREKASLDALYARLQVEFPGTPLLQNSRYLFPDGVFFDDVSHLGTAHSRALRTAYVVEDIRAGLAGIGAAANVR